MTHNGHPVIPPFEHTWVAKLVNGEINGFHQDKMQYYENLGLIKDVELLAEDFYRAKVCVNGKWVKRSFFPAKWTDDDLMECFHDVVKYPDDIIQQIGKTLYRKIRPSGIKVSVVIEDVSGIGITYFPNLRSKS